MPPSLHNQVPLLSERHKVTAAIVLERGSTTGEVALETRYSDLNGRSDSIHDVIGYFM